MGQLHMHRLHMPPWLSWASSWWLQCLSEMQGFRVLSRACNLCMNSFPAARCPAGDLFEPFMTQYIKAVTDNRLSARLCGPSQDSTVGQQNVLKGLLAGCNAWQVHGNGNSTSSMSLGPDACRLASGCCSLPCHWLSSTQRRPTLPAVHERFAQKLLKGREICF